MASLIETAGKNAMLDHLGGITLYAALYTDIAGTTEVTGGSPAYARKAITFAAAANGVLSARHRCRKHLRSWQADKPSSSARSV
jgi:hypothetical protein